MIALLPWHETPLRTLLAQRDRLSHALLLYGPRGIGKVEFARALAQSMLCESPENGIACGSCTACGWFAEGNHPDYREVQPTAQLDDETNNSDEIETAEKTSQEIVINQIRELGDFIALSTHRGGYRVLVLHPAETMNIAAANALLKTLEEPPPHTLIVLVTHQMGRLLATIRSRCQRVMLAPPDQHTALAWLAAQNVPHPELALAQFGGAPLAAREGADPALQADREHLLTGLTNKPVDYIALADMLSKSLVKGKEHKMLAQIMNWMQTWVYDLVAAKMAGQVRFHPDRRAAIEKLVAPLVVQKLLRFESALRQMRRTITHPLNSRLFLEQLLISYVEATSHGTSD